MVDGRFFRIFTLGGVLCTKANLMMNGLKVYVNSKTIETRCGRPVFYSRRDDGPHYQWFYDEAGCRWRAGRVLISSISRKMLSPATWKELPAGLRINMVEHYQD